MKRLVLLLAAAALIGAGTSYAALSRYQIVVHHDPGAVWAEFRNAGEACRYTAPGTILCYSTTHTARGDYGVFFTPTRLAVVQYEPDRFATRYTATER